MGKYNKKKGNVNETNQQMRRNPAREGREVCRESCVQATTPPKDSTKALDDTKLTEEARHEARKHHSAEDSFHRSVAPSVMRHEGIEMALNNQRLLELKREKEPRR